MEKVNQILKNPLYQTYLSQIERYEKDRIYCKHDMAHFLDVARIAYIWNLEMGLKYEKATIYGFAILHDIGRWCEYETKEPHDIASVRLSEALLKATDYRPSEIELILGAIAKHRVESMPVTRDDETFDTFDALMHRADKASRLCHQCQARESCYWSDEKKNLIIEV